MATVIVPHISSVTNPILAGSTFGINGANFTSGSKVNFFVATATGPINAGPFTPVSRTPAHLTVSLPALVPLGEGFASVQVVNTDTGYSVSNAGYALLQGNPAAGIPTIKSVNGKGLAATSSNPAYAVNNVETVVRQGQAVQIGGSGFDTVNGAAVDLFCACPPANRIPTIFLHPGDPRLTATLLTVTLPPVSQLPTGPGSFVVTNVGADKSYKRSNAVSAVVGAQIQVLSVTQSGSTITVNGAGFSTLTVINFFNSQVGGVKNLGGYVDGKPAIALAIKSANQFTFAVPAGAVPEASFVQAINPPFTPYNSSGDQPGGAFTLK